MLNEKYLESIKNIMKNGIEAEPRGLKTKELIGFQFTTQMKDCIITLKERKLNYAFMVAEWLWIMFGREDVAFIEKFNKRIKYYSDDGYKFYGAYGPRFEEQFMYVYETLSNDPDSRQAVMTFWHRTPEKSKDIPCTISLHFLIRNSRLHVISNLRSNDVWFGMPYDTFNFCQIGNFLVGMLNGCYEEKIHRGLYILNANSYHLYEPQFDEAEKLQRSLKGFYPEKIKFDQFDFYNGGFNYQHYKKLFNELAMEIAHGKLTETDLSKFPRGLKEHIDLLNRYARKDNLHKEQSFWKPAYDLLS